MEDGIVYKFPSNIRKQGTQMVLNVPKELHSRIEADSDEPHTVEVEARLLFPKTK